MGHVYQGVCKVYLDGINLKVFNKLSLIIINYFSKTSKVSKAAQRKRFVIERFVIKPKQKATTKAEIKIRRVRQMHVYALIDRKTLRPAQIWFENFNVCVVVVPS